MRTFILTVLSVIARISSYAQPSEGTEPSWSPDGKKIVFTSGKFPEGRELYVMNADGSDVKQLTKDAFADEYPSFSPDGKKILFSSNREGAWKLYVMNADGTNIVSTGIATGGQWYSSCKSGWSPNGKKLVYSVTADGKTFLYTANADGTGQKSLNIEGSYPQWSPDGKKIAYYFNHNIYLSDEDGKNAVKFSQVGESGQDMANFPAWSHDAKKIYMIEQNKLVMRDVTKGVQADVITGADRKFYPQLSPDGKYIAFMIIDPAKQMGVIYKANIDGSNKVLLTK